MTKKIENLKMLKTDELQKNLIDLKEQIRVIRFRGQGAKAKNVKEVATLKKKVAQTLTELNSKDKLK